MGHVSEVADHGIGVGGENRVGCNLTICGVSDHAAAMSLGVVT